MKKFPCPECGRRIRPSNLARHRRAQHLPRGRARKFGMKFSVPAIPIRVGQDQDRRYDEHVPRGEGPNKFRIYRLRRGELELLATAPDSGSMGLALVTLHSEGEFITDDAVGVLDTATEPGHWIVSPWTLGRRKLPEALE